MIGVVTDSSCQLTWPQAAAAGIVVVPLHVRIDDTEYREGVDLDVDDFYDRVAEGASVSTSQPSPGSFVETYARLADEGATSIVSVHVDESASGTLNSARLAAADAPVPVHLVDSKTTSYGLGVLALAIADVVANADASPAAIDELVEERRSHLSTVFTLPDLNFATRGGRMRPPAPHSGDDVMVFGGVGGGYDLLGSGRSVPELIDAMADFLLAGEHRRHVAIALAAPETLVFTEGLEARMEGSDAVDSVHRYRMGPSIAVHTGPGTAGGFAWPVRETAIAPR